MRRQAFVFFLSAISLDCAETLTYRNTEPGAAYTGSGVCAGCHAKIYRDYVRTAMGRSMSLATPAAFENVPVSASIFSERLNRHFEVARAGSSIFQSEYELDASGREVFLTRYELKYAIGSGVNGYGYIVRRDNFLFQAPLSYYPRKRAWGLAPGYDAADYGFNRPIAAACIACHSGQPQPVAGRAGLFRDPPFRELAIGCENCHGPGALHVAKRAANVPIAQGTDRTIVNPGRLPARLAEDICMNCHQGSETRVLQPGRDYFDFRPGKPLSETLAILLLPLKREAPVEADLLGHHFSMRLSRCYRASEGRLSCLTCHQVHSMPRPAEVAAYYRAKCLKCHTDTSCRTPKVSRLSSANDCAGCHMPKRPVEVLPHALLTNHRILARHGEPLPEAAFLQANAGAADLVYFNRPQKTDRTSLPPIMLLQAYGELMRKDATYQRRYLSVLEQLARERKPQPLVEAALGRKLLHAGPESNTAAIEHLKLAIELGFDAPTVYEDLAAALLREKREVEAVLPLRRGIELEPYTPALHKSLALCYINLQRYAEARVTLERYLDLFPEDDFVRGLLLKVKATDDATRN